MTVTRNGSGLVIAAFRRHYAVRLDDGEIVDCVLKGREPEPSGVEGLIDVRIIEAIRESYSTGRPVKLEKMPIKKRPSLAQEIERPANEEQELVKVSPPSE